MNPFSATFTSHDRSGTAAKGVTGCLGRVLGTFEQWHLRARTRRHLRGLDERLRLDVGLDRDAAMREARKPFWQR
ncbi:MAG TPA: DUF1127 domain-containing protein [Gammaproteobacteria bacterium]|nr:DUF1127 domain-containing protein [Gammaproteobacteria bacterium]